MRRVRPYWLITMLCLLLTACSRSAAENQRTETSAPPTDPSVQVLARYAAFAELARDLPVSFQPPGFEILNYHPENAVYYGFDAEMAWGKRAKTVLFEDDSKPTQHEYLYMEQSTQIVSAVEIMFIPTPLEPDVIGFMSVPEQEAQISTGAAVQVRPPENFIEVFSYGHAVVLIQTFGVNRDQGADPQALVAAHKKLSLGLRDFLAERHADLTDAGSP